MEPIDRRTILTTGALALAGAAAQSSPAAAQAGVAPVTTAAHSGAIAASAASLLLLGFGAAGAAGAPNGTQTPYAQQATVTCLKHRGAVVGRIIPTNRRLRAMRLQQQRNVILLSPKTATRARATVVGCLRT